MSGFATSTNCQSLHNFSQVTTQVQDHPLQQQTFPFPAAQEYNGINFTHNSKDLFFFFFFLMGTSFGTHYHTALSPHLRSPI